jgi:protein SCO1/2
MTARRMAAALACAAVLASLTGCEKLFAPAKSPFNGIDVTGTEMGGSLRLDDATGASRTLADWRGKVVVVSFGFTHCPDVCPTTLADLAKAVRQLGNDAANVQVLFVTVDPKRDSREVIGQYVPNFHPSFVGLRGDEAATLAATKAFHVYAKERPGASPESYTVDHSSQTFVLDREGRLRLILPYGSKPEAMASDLKVLLNS